MEKLYFNKKAYNARMQQENKVLKAINDLREYCQQNFEMKLTKQLAESFLESQAEAILKAHVSTVMENGTTARYLEPGIREDFTRHREPLSGLWTKLSRDIIGTSGDFGIYNFNENSVTLPETARVKIEALFTLYADPSKDELMKRTAEVVEALNSLSEFCENHGHPAPMETIIQIGKVPTNLGTEILNTDLMFIPNPENAANFIISPFYFS